MAIALGAIKTFFSGINIPLAFYKFLAVGAVSLIVLTATYREGLHDGENRALAEQMGDLKTQIVEERRTIINELDIRQKRIVQRIEDVSKDSQRANQLQRELDTIGATLNDLIKKKPSNPACAPSRSVWEEYRKLAEATKPTR